MKSYESEYHLGAVQQLAADINQWAKEKGFWSTFPISTLTAEDHQKIVLMQKSQKIMLVVTELAELIEGLRKPDPAAAETFGFINEEEEVADAIIRLLDYSGHYGLRIGEALGAKMAKNEGRPYKHGKEF